MSFLFTHFLIRSAQHTVLKLQNCELTTFGTIDFAFADGLCITLKHDVGLLCGSHQNSKLCHYFDGARFINAPHTRLGHNSGGMATYRERALIVAGHESDANMDNYNLETEVWDSSEWTTIYNGSSLAALVNAQYSDFTLVELESQIFAFGGMIDGVWTASESVFIFDNNGWRESGKSNINFTS